MAPVTPLYINGDERLSSKTYDVRNPLSGQVVGTAVLASSQDCKDAVEAAGKAFVTWETTSFAVKRDIFLKASDLFQTDKYRAKVIDATMEETAADVGWSAYVWFLSGQLLRYMVTLANDLQGESFPSVIEGGHVIVQRRAMGVILSIAPWNAPLYLAMRAIAMPILCGNTVVLKCSESSPRSQTIIAELLQEAGLPKGVINTISTTRDISPTATAELIAHPLVRKIAFTGSAAVGKAIASEAAKHLKPCTLELSGKAPVVVLNDANITLAAKNIVFGGMANSGQICLSTEIVIVQREASKELLSSVSNLCRALKAGNIATDPDAKLPPLINAHSAERVLGLLLDAKAKGADILVGDLKRDGAIIQPHLLSGVQPGTELWENESFGPVIVVSVVDTVDEAVALANSSEYTMTASLWTNNVHTALEVGPRIRTSFLNINGATMHGEARIHATGLGGPSGYGSFDVADFTDRRAMILHPPNQTIPLVD